MTRPRATLLALAAAVASAAAVVAMAQTGPPRHPTTSSSPLVSIGHPITPYRAGKPKRGWMEMRAADPAGGPRRGVLYHSFRKERRGRVLRHVCNEVGFERELRRYPVRDGGSCMPLDPRLPREPLTFSYGTGTRLPVTLTGTASADVERVVADGPGGIYELPLSRHRAFLAIYSREAKGKVTLSAHLRDGSTRFHEIELPPTFVSPGSARAKDPGGLPDWTVAAGVQPRGGRRGQTCAQFRQLHDDDASRGRAGGEFGSPLCGELDRHPLFADATRWGPRKEYGPFGPFPRSPKRLIVWGAAAPSVTRIDVEGPDGARQLPLSEVGRAFITIYPASVRPADVTLIATLADGRQLRFPAPDDLNVRRLRDQPRLVRTRLALRVDAAGTGRHVLSGRLDRRARAFRVSLHGRQLTMRRRRGTEYAAVYDSTKGKRRAIVRERIYPTQVVLCGPEGCSTTLIRVRAK